MKIAYAHKADLTDTSPLSFVEEITRQVQSRPLEMTFFVPARNEERNIGKVVEEILVAMRTFPERTFEIILVDDGSTDGTFAKMDAARQAAPEANIRIYQNKTATGRLVCLNRVAWLARGKRMTMIGGHFQDRREAIQAMQAAAHQAHLIIAHLEPDGRDLVRRVLSAIYTRIINTLTGLDILYFNGISIFPMEDILLWAPKREGVFTAEMILTSLCNGRSYTQVGVPCYPRSSGKTKTLNPRNFGRVGAFFMHLLFSSASIRRQINSRQR